MAGPRAHYNPCHNLLPGGKDELARGAFTKSNNIHTLIPTTSYAPTPAPALALLFNNGLFQ